jgi:hypothetical protein
VVAWNAALKLPLQKSEWNKSWRSLPVL